MIRIALILAVAWSALAVQPGLSELLKVTGVAILAAALCLDRATPAALMRQPALLMLGLVVASSSWFALEPAVWLGSAARAQGALIALALLVLAAAASRLRAGDRRSVYVAVALLGGLISVHVLLQRAGLDPLSWQGRIDQRPSATLSNATILAGWLLLVLPPTLALAVSAARWRGAWMVLVALQFTALLASGTRSAILALLLVATGGWLLGASRTRRARLALLTAIVAITVALVAWRPASLQDRAHLWHAAAGALLAPPTLVDLRGQSDPHGWLRPWLGYGCDGQQPALTAATTRGVGARAETAGWVADRAHQGVLDRALEQGAAGLFALLLLLVAVARALWAGKHADDPGRRIQSLALAVALGAWMLHLQASFGLTGDRTLASIWIGIALALGRGDEGNGVVAPASGRWGQWVLTSAALVAAAGLLLGGLAAGGALPAAISARLAPALAAEREFGLGQQAYAQALATTGSQAAASMLDAAAAFERAVDHRRFDVDAALAAASARIEAAALSGAADEVARARAWATAVRRIAPADPRLAAVDARIDSIAGRAPAMPPR